MKSRLGTALGTAILMSLAIAPVSIAQTGTISGRVTAAVGGEPLQGRSDQREGNIPRIDRAN